MAGISKDRVVRHAIHSSRLARMPPELDELLSMQAYADGLITRQELRSRLIAPGFRKAALPVPPGGDLHGECD